MDGRKQRQAVTAAEQAIRALADGDGAKAGTAARRAATLDQIGLYAGFAHAVEDAAAELASRGAVQGGWDGIIEALGPGPLALEVEVLRGR